MNEDDDIDGLDFGEQAGPLPPSKKRPLHEARGWMEQAWDIAVTGWRAVVEEMRKKKKGGGSR